MKKNFFFFFFFLFILASCASTPPSKTKGQTGTIRSEGTKASVTAANQAKAEVTHSSKKGSNTSKNSETADQVNCKHGPDTRKISKRMSEVGGCEVLYQKNGTETVIARAKADLAYCDKAQEKLKATLISAGFSCE